jgi:excisionase family DNA binding protein
MAENATVEPVLATIMEAARYLRLSRAKVYEMMNDRTLASVRLGGSRRIPWSTLRELVEKSTTPAAG